MKNVEVIRSFEEIKLLADPRRREVLRLLMASPSTLTHLARLVGQSPAWVRHHVRALESGNLVELAEIRKTGKVTEKLYRARSDAFVLRETVLPHARKTAVIFAGSHDLALERIAEHLRKRVAVLTLPVGSLDGLIHLRQGLCQLSGSHLRDESGEYNLPYVRHLFPDRAVSVVTLAHRTQGLMLARGNPAGVRTIADLAKTGVRLVSRNPGSGTHLWLEAELRRLDVAPEHIRRHKRSAQTHSEAARLVASGKADAAVGLQAASRQFELEFIPLFEERYDLVLPRENQKVLSPLLDFIQTRHFRSAVASLNGYNTAHSGEQVI